MKCGSGAFQQGCPQKLYKLINRLFRIFHMQKTLYCIAYPVISTYPAALYYYCFYCYYYKKFDFEFKKPFFEKTGFLDFPKNFSVKIFSRKVFEGF